MTFTLRRSVAVLAAVVAFAPGMAATSAAATQRHSTRGASAPVRTPAAHSSAVSDASANASSLRHPSALFGTNEIVGMACPSVKQCTVLTSAGVQVTFNPVHGGKLIAAKLFSDTESESFALDCATESLCVAADSTGVVVGFDPRHEKAKPKYTTTLSNASYQTSVACPTKSLCVLDSYQAEGYLNPAKRSTFVSNAFAANQNGGNPTTTCLSNTFCLGSNGNGSLVYTYNPRSPAKAKTTTLTSTLEVGQISCPTSKQCTALAAYDDGSGAGSNLGMFTFNPHKLGTKPKVHDVSESSMGVIACASKTYCIGGGYDAGAYIYDTKTHKHKFAALPDTLQTTIAALACPSKSMCIATLEDGKKAVFNPAKRPKKLKVEGLTKKA
jgi:hypothetical protein